jgi:hypothetical protein
LHIVGYILEYYYKISQCSLPTPKLIKICSGVSETKHMDREVKYNSFPNYIITKGFLTMANYIYDYLAFGFGPLSSAPKCTETITHDLKTGPISVLIPWTTGRE